MTTGPRLSLFYDGNGMLREIAILLQYVTMNLIRLEYVLTKKELSTSIYLT